MVLVFSIHQRLGTSVSVVHPALDQEADLFRVQSRFSGRRGLGTSFWLVLLNPGLKCFATGRFAGRMAHRVHKGPQWDALGLASASAPLFPLCLVHFWFLSTKLVWASWLVSSRNRSAAGLPTSGVVYQQYNWSSAEIYQRY